MGLVSRYRIWIWNNALKIQRFFRIAGVPVTLSALAGIVYYYGFPKTNLSSLLSHLLIDLSLVFYLLRFICQLLINLHPWQLLKGSLFEGILMLLILVELAGSTIFNFNFLEFISSLIGIEDYRTWSIVFIQIYFFVILIIEIEKSSLLVTRLNISPSGLLILSFFLLITAGALLLMLPEMTTEGISFLDAFFTSASASCVTGLIVVDTATAFTFKGQIIIMLLIQLGGINIIAFATFFIAFYRKSSGIKHMSIIKDITSSQRISETKPLLRKILLYSLLFELLGSLILYFCHDGGYNYSNNGGKVFSSLFHSVSAFNNAGFSLFHHNLCEQNIITSYGYHLVIAFLVIFGGLGFIVLQDIFKKSLFSGKIRAWWKSLSVNSKIVLVTTFVLLITGSVMIGVLEKSNTMKGMTGEAMVVTSFFQSVSARTAGFNTVDISSLTLPTIVILILLMFIGASPGSTGGGIKTTTFSVFVRAALSTVRRKPNLSFYKRTVSSDIIFRAFSIVIFSLSVIFISVFILTITEPDINLSALLFEEVSAFSTVGLSTGITSSLSATGKIVIMASMLIGRVGTLTLAIALSGKKSPAKHSYPEVNINVG